MQDCADGGQCSHFNSLDSEACAKGEPCEQCDAAQAAFFSDGPTPTRRDRIRAKLMSRTDIVDTGYETPCHLWTGPTSGDGKGGDYGRMSLDGATVATHIAAWTNEHGLIPPRKQLDHLCGQRRCWREDHLELVTHRKNQRRRDQRRKTQ